MLARLTKKQAKRTSVSNPNKLPGNSLQRIQSPDSASKNWQMLAKPDQ
jgi:hypothetical protein